MGKKTAAKRDWKKIPEKLDEHKRFVDFLERYQNVLFAVIVVALLCVVGLVLLRRHYRLKEAEARVAVEEADTAVELEALLRENEGTSLEPFIRYRLAGAYMREGRQKEALAEHRTLQDRWGGKSIYAQFAADASSRISRNLAFQEEVLPGKLKDLENQRSEKLGPPAPEPEGPETTAPVSGETPPSEDNPTPPPENKPLQPEQK